MKRILGLKLVLLVLAVSCTKENSLNDLTNLDCRSRSVKKIVMYDLPGGQDYVDITIQNTCQRCSGALFGHMTIYLLHRVSLDTLAFSSWWEFPLIPNKETITYSLRASTVDLPASKDLQVYIPFICVDIPNKSN